MRRLQALINAEYYNILNLKFIKMNSQCCKCGANLTYPCSYNNKIYGSDCLATELGLKKMPFWFNYTSKETYEYQKKSYQEKQSNISKVFESMKANLFEVWDDFLYLSIAKAKARMCRNDWATNFLQSVADQLGYGSLIDYYGIDKMPKTFEEFVTKENESGRSIGFSKPAKKISTLSQKQLNIIEKYA